MYRLVTCALATVALGCGASSPAAVPARPGDAPPGPGTAPAAGIATLASEHAAGGARDRPRVHAPAGLVRIYEKPDRDAPVIGALRAGQSVVMKDATLSPQRRYKREYLCDEGWYPIEPRGFVCVGGADHATKDGEDPRVLAARAALPDVTADYPFHYGVSVGAPQYRRIPSREEQHEMEKDLDAYLASPAARDDSKGGAVDTTPANRPPAPIFLKYLEMSKPALVDPIEAYRGMKVSWTQELDANGRTWLLTPDMTLLPKDKVRQKPLPTLRGIDLKAHPEVQLPLAFFWLQDTPALKMGDAGKLVPAERVFLRHSFVRTSLEQVRGPHGRIYWNVDGEYYVPFQSVSILKKAQHLPPGASAREKWVEVRITWGYLIAYEGAEPVYATAISPGQDGIANAAHSTARGKHHIKWKLLSGDMSGRERGADWYVQEVPWVQYYQDNYAAHGAWWHDDFGRPKSHGCVNIAPTDARFLFHWMDPPMPEGWYAVSPYAPVAKSTMIYIRP